MKIMSDYDKQQMIQTALNIWKKDPDNPKIKEIIQIVVGAIIVEVCTEGDIFGDIPVR